MPLVSIVIPTFNRPDYLRNAIRSAVGQSHKNIEIIVLDDAGPADNEAVASSFHDERIRYIRNESNKGIFSNNLTGFRLARGKYLVDLNDDDQLESGFLEKLVAVLEATPEAVIAFCDHFVMNEEGVIDHAFSDKNTRMWKRDQLAPGLHKHWSQMALLDQSIPMVMGTVMRREEIDWDFFPPDVGAAYDYWLAYLAWKSGQAAYYVSERLTSYRVHSGQQTATGRIGNLKSKIACLQYFLHDPLLSSIHGKLRARLNVAHCRLGRVLLAAGDTEKARLNFTSGWRGASLPDYCAFGLSFAPEAIRRTVLELARSMR
jgi:glycosyltransferase involved in cell wall biosynthesis